MMAGKKCIVVSASIDTIKGNFITTISEDPHDYKDVSIDMESVKCDIDLCRGDRVALRVFRAKSPFVYEIAPIENLKEVEGVITFCSDDCAIIESTRKDQPEKYLYYRTESDPSVQLSAHTKATVIHGDYRHCGKEYDYRCLKIKCEPVPKNVQKKNERPKTTNGTATKGVRQRQREVWKRIKNHYNLPIELVKAFESASENETKKRIEALMPIRTLSIENYAKRLHDCIYLEEMHLRKELQGRSDEVCFQWEEKPKSIFKFQHDANNEEPRTQISVGDQIFARKVNAPGTVYPGKIKSIFNGLFKIEFGANFLRDFNNESYTIEYRPHRAMFLKRHEAVDNAVDLFSLDFLFPKAHPEPKPAQLDVVLVDNKLQLDGKEVPWFNNRLNVEQMQAVVVALRGECRPQPALINGPPGTGKTTVITEIALQLHKYFPKHRILITTQSNSAADLMTKRLLQAHEPIAADILRVISNSVFQANSLSKELEKYSACIGEDKNAENVQPQNNVKKYGISHLKKFRIVVSTCVAIGMITKNQIDNGHFNHIMLEEAGQCDEAESLIPMTLINPQRGQIIMSGDPQQLSPLAMSFFAKHRGNDVSMFERFLKQYLAIGVGDSSKLVRKLVRNYRALPSIVDFYSKQFYDSELIATLSPEDSAEAKLLNQVCRQGILPVSPEQSFGMYFVDVYNGKSCMKENSKSLFNFEEVCVLKSLLHKLLASQIVTPGQIGIIAPYHSQVLLLKKSLGSSGGLLIGSVEQFQGEERMVIFISTVRTAGNTLESKFVFSPKRLNTAISRARAIVVVLGKAEHLKRDPNWAEYIKICEANGTFSIR